MGVLGIRRRPRCQHRAIPALGSTQAVGRDGGAGVIWLVEVQPGEKVGSWTVASEGAAVIVMQDGGESVGEELIREEQ